MNIFVFDIETIPDVELGRKLLNLHDLDDQQVVQAMELAQVEKSGNAFIKLHAQKICAISCVFRHSDSVKVWSLGEKESSEKELIERFFDGLGKFMPTLVSWNGTGFDLPVIHYRALLHRVKSQVYWETGDFDSNFRWNNYLNRYHNRHLDLMDTLACYQAKAYAPLDQIASMLGFPGKMGMDGSKVWPAVRDGDLDSVRNYCETDVLNTYLVYLRFEEIRGKLSDDEYTDECDLLAAHLEEQNKPHLTEFLNQWRSNE